MGITSFWDVVKDQDRVVAIAKLAEDHHKTHGRPLRIAIDEADWRFNNLTAQQVFTIRQTSNQPYKGVEKAIFYRICRWLTLNVQLLFVFDGPKRPWKKGRIGGNRVDYEGLKDIKRLLTAFRIPSHHAPAEAEAECARLQQLGIVDAVFSQDSDTLMFGCDFLIRDDRVTKDNSNNRAKENTQKSAKTVKVIRGPDLKQAHGLDRDGLVLFAMLAGGDYAEKGLPGCGEATARRAVKAGLGTTLCQCQTKQDCLRWRDSLVSFLRTAPRGSQITVPLDFPDIKILNKYNKPKISTDDQLRNLRGLRQGWEKAIDERKLLEITGTMFNIWGRLYLNWITPVLLTRSFVAQNTPMGYDNPHDIKVKKGRAKKDDFQPTPRPLERKITFCPFGLTSLTRTDFEGGDRAGYWAGVEDVPFDPEHRVEWEMPDYWLQKCLPSDVLDPPAPAPKPKRAPKKRKQDEDQVDTVHSSPKRKKKPHAATQPSKASPVIASLAPKLATPRVSTSRLSSTNLGSPVSSAPVIDLLSDSESDELPELNFYGAKPVVAPSARMKQPLTTRPKPIFAPQPRSSTILDLGDSFDDTDNEDDDVQEAIRLSIEDMAPYNGSSSTFTPQTPRQDRAIVHRGFLTSPDTLFVPEKPPLSRPTVVAPRSPEKAAGSRAFEKQAPTSLGNWDPQGQLAKARSLMDCPDWSLPSLQPEMRIPRMQASSPPSFIHEDTLSRPEQAQMARQSALPTIPYEAAAELEDEPTSLEQLRAARLRRFASQKNDDPLPASNTAFATPPSATEVAHSECRAPPAQRPAKKVQEPAKKAQIVCIDLTDD